MVGGEARRSYANELITEDMLFKKMHRDRLKNKNELQTHKESTCRQNPRYADITSQIRKDEMDTSGVRIRRVSRSVRQANVT
jgi:hypothetical protein